VLNLIYGKVRILFNSSQESSEKQFQAYFPRHHFNTNQVRSKSSRQKALFPDKKEV
jgi:hypothetical protein